MTAPGIDISGYFSPIRLDEMDAVRLMNRIDTKYVMSVHKLPEFLKMMDGGYSVLEINGNRVFSYFTTYLDTRDYTFFNQHVSGRPDRSKVRYRTYVNTGNTFLEIKQKTVRDRTVKWRIESGRANGDAFDSEAMEFINSHIREKMLSLQPVICNEFNRITFVRKDFGERLTIDFNISFSRNGTGHIDLPGLTIIELKQDGYSPKSDVASMLRSLSVYPTGFSKYCAGVSALCDAPKRSYYKAKLLSIKKIENEFNSSNCSRTA